MCCRKAKLVAPLDHVDEGMMSTQYNNCDKQQNLDSLHPNIVKKKVVFDGNVTKINKKRIKEDPNSSLFVNQ